ncbi:hypothetical protein [Paraburkholderia sediminicola]|uniref:hypothetical protein n=1 Tax=Paraburkholderia sediminicola TaxID=458836 RepID=UPI0038BDC8E7
MYSDFFGRQKMTQDGAFSIEEVSGDLRDLRSLTPAHDLTEVLVVALCAILSSADSGVTIQTCAERSWSTHLLPASADQVVTLDGKTVRGAACASPGIGQRQWLGRGTGTGTHGKQKQQDHGDPEVVRPSNGISFRAPKSACTRYST